MKQIKGGAATHSGAKSWPEIEIRLQRAASRRRKALKNVKFVFFFFTLKKEY